MKKIARFMLICALFVFASVFAGNGIECYQQKYGMLDERQYTITFDKDTVTKWEDESEKEFADGKIAKAYKVKDYFETFCGKITDSSSYYSSSENSDGSVEFIFLLVSSYTSPAESDENYESVVEKGFFRTKYTVKRTNPMLQLVNSFKSGEAEEDTPVYYLLNGITSGSRVELPAIAKVFPSSAEFDFADAKVSYYLAETMWHDSSDADPDERVMIGGKYFDGWVKQSGEEIQEYINYVYYVPASAGWGITLGGASLVLVAILFAVTSFKKEKSSFADYRGADEYSTQSLVDERAYPNEKSSSLGGSDSKDNVESKDGYKGNGVFAENGKTVDVFGNETDSAPVDSNPNKEQPESGTPPDIFGNDV